SAGCRLFAMRAAVATSRGQSKKPLRKHGAEGLRHCGGGGIRTPGELAPTAVFKTATIGHSVTPPGAAARTLGAVDLCVNGREHVAEPPRGFLPRAHTPCVMARRLATMVDVQNCSRRGPTCCSMVTTKRWPGP